MTTSQSGIVFYLDSSALVKRYLIEPGSSWIVALCRPSTGNTIATGQITKAEVAATFARKHRNDNLSQSNYAIALQDLTHHFVYQYLILDTNQAIVDLAVDLTQRQKLRGYDAIQLASALTLNNVLTQAQSIPLTFVAADDDLLQTAQNEGLSTDNPNLHP